MTSLLMSASLLLGLLALILPAMNIIDYKRNYKKDGLIYSIISISSCAIAISFQLVYSNHMVNIGDWSGLMDTAGTSTRLSLILLITSLVLNGISIIIYNNEK